MRNKIYEATGRYKAELETWDEFFERANKEGAIDLKTVSKLLVIIFEELENGKNNPRSDAEYTRFEFSEEDGAI